MNLSYWCILIAGILPVVTVAVAKWGRRDFDNAEPRQWICLLYTSPSPRDS